MATINSGSGSIYDPSLPSRIALGTAETVPLQPVNTITSIDPGQGPQYDPSFGLDTNSAAAPDDWRSQPYGGHSTNYGPPTPAPGATTAPVGPLTYSPSFPLDAGGYKPSFNPNAPGISSILARTAQPVSTRQAVPLNKTPMPPVRPAGLGSPPTTVQTAQAPTSATPQGWNLFAAIGQALGHLLGYNAQGQPQGMTGLIRNPVQTAPTQTAALRMPTQLASRYQGRTLVG